MHRGTGGNFRGSENRLLGAAAPSVGVKAPALGERVVNFATRNPPHRGHRILRSMRGNAALLRLVKLRIEMWLCAVRRRERT